VAQHGLAERGYGGGRQPSRVKDGHVGWFVGRQYAPPPSAARKNLLAHSRNVLTTV
jgi:hypothetical protein